MTGRSGSKLRLRAERHNAAVPGNARRERKANEIKFILNLSDEHYKNRKWDSKAAKYFFLIMQELHHALPQRDLNIKGSN
jgi:hypothetical protein